MLNPAGRSISSVGFARLGQRRGGGPGTHQNVWSTRRFRILFEPTLRSDMASRRQYPPSSFPLGAVSKAVNHHFFSCCDSVVFHHW